MNIFDLLYATDLDVTVSFDGDGKDSFEHSLRISYKSDQKLYEHVTYDMRYWEIDEIRDKLTLLLKQLNKELDL